MRLIDADEALRLFGEEYEKTKELIHNGETQLDSLAEGFTEAGRLIGKTVFLTREEAEKALEALKNA